VAVRAADDNDSNGATATAEQAVSSEQVAAPAGQPSAPADQEPLPELELEYSEPSGGQKAWTGFKLAFALPWRRVKSGSALVLKLSGQVAEQPQGRFSSTVSLPALCDCLKKAALDPRISGVVVKIDPLACGWGKLQVSAPEGVGGG
jgi:protease-4